MALQPRRQLIRVQLPICTISTAAGPGDNEGAPQRLLVAVQESVAGPTLPTSVLQQVVGYLRSVPEPHHRRSLLPSLAGLEGPDRPWPSQRPLGTLTRVTGAFCGRAATQSCHLTSTVAKKASPVSGARQ